MGDDVRSRIFAPSLMLLMGVRCAFAASVVATPIQNTPDTALVVVSGEFQPGDAERFRSAVAIYPKGVVAFESTGGNLLAAIDIGTQIRLRNYATVVPDNTVCASACATAWLGGSRRFMGRHALIGFHAAYVTEDGHSVETGAPNALLGAYLNKLGLPDRAVVFITQAHPEGMTWLTLEAASREGIDVSLFVPPDEKAGAPAATAAPTVAPPSQAGVQVPIVKPTADAELAKRVARNFTDRYKAAGMTGLKISVQSCYGVAIKAAKERSLEYCYLLDLFASAIDAGTLKKLGMQQEQYWLANSVSERAAGALRLVAPANSSIPQTLQSWGALLNTVAHEAAEIVSQDQAATSPPSVTVAPPTGQLPYLFDQIKKPSYRASLSAIVGDTKILPPWVVGFLQTSNGVAAPGKAIQLGAGVFELYTVCQPHNCSGNFLYVLYSPGGGKAWALVTRDDQVIALLGDASPDQTQALIAAQHQ
ncbi:Inhibitor of vertebrate lysozyme (Ivy) [Rhizobiales bacterium GAS113]|nr:Inhibitor of vertebrate lysozyme (Ivy) [Rhizobiales bacterium GAS113]